jgi:hypothetical protein
MSKIRLGRLTRDWRLTEHGAYLLIAEAWNERRDVFGVARCFQTFWWQSR